MRNDREWLVPLTGIAFIAWAVWVLIVSVLLSTRARAAPTAAG